MLASVIFLPSAVVSVFAEEGPSLGFLWIRDFLLAPGIVLGVLGGEGRKAKGGGRHWEYHAKTGWVGVKGVDSSWAKLCMQHCAVRDIDRGRSVSGSRRQQNSICSVVLDSK